MIAEDTLRKEEVFVITYQTSQCNKAFGDLYEMFYNQLFDYVLKITDNADDAFDITQETFIVAARELHKLRVPITFRFWLFRIAKHMCMKRFRSLSKMPLDVYALDLTEQSYDGVEASDREAKLDQLALVMSSLPQEDQELLLAKYSEGKSIKDIMHTTQLGSSAIKMKLMGARGKVLSGFHAY